MKIKEYIQSLIQIIAHNAEKGEQLKKGIPLGFDEYAKPIVAHEEDCPARYHHICVTGANRSDYIRRLILTLCKLYGQDNVSFLILSPDRAYGELLHVKNADIAVPFINRYADCNQALDTVRELVRIRTSGEEVNYPKLFVVLDGLEDTLEEKSERQSFECFKPFFDVVGSSGVELITGVELEKSIFSSYPGVFVGHGNALVSTDALGKADVTYVGIDSCLSLPLGVSYPEDLSILECIAALNANA